MMGLTYSPILFLVNYIGSPKEDGGGSLVGGKATTLNMLLNSRNRVPLIEVTD